MAKPKRANCHACGQALREEETQCPRCRVSRRGDANRPMIAAYTFFLFVAFVTGAFIIMYLRNTTNLQ